MTSNERKEIFQEMSLDMMKEILAFTHNPKKAVPWLLEQIRKLTKARNSALVKCTDRFSKKQKTSYKLIGINPDKIPSGIDNEFYFSLMKLAHETKELSVISEDENEAYYQILKNENIEISLILPIVTDEILLGAFIILDLPKEVELEQIKEELESLSNIFALTFKGAIFYMDMEEMVEQRTKSLKQSEKKYKNIIQTTKDGFWLLDKSGKFLDVNESYCKVSGYTREELLDMSITDVEANEDISAIIIHFKKVIRTGHDLYESLQRRKDGSIFFVEVSTSFLSTEDGNLFVAFVRDISERKKKETLIKRQRQRLLNIIEGTDVGTWEWNIQTGATIFNEKWANIIGYTLQELEPVSINTWLNYSHPDDMQKCNNLLEKHFKGEVDYYHSECRMKHKAGHWVWILDRGKVVNWTDDGKPLWMYGTHKNITERKKGELALLESEARFKALHNASFGGILIHDDRLILECNAQLTKLTGFSYDELVGQDTLSLISEETKNLVINRIQKNYERPYEAVGVRKDGSTYPLRLEAKAIPFKGKDARVVEFRDITELKRAEAAKRKLEYQLQQSQKLEAIGTLTGGIAHDFNNLLTPIMGYADIIKYKMPPDDPNYDSIVEILNSSVQAKELIKQLLTFSRKNETKVAPLNLIPVIKSSVKLIRSSLPASVHIKTDIPEQIDNIMANNTQIHQIIMNLCINSSHAMLKEDGIPNGQINVQVKQISIDEISKKQFVNLKIGSYIQIIVSDNGKGMSQEILSHIFDPFYTTKKEGRGTGMGLAVVHGIVKSYEGEIKVYSQIDKGTTFNIFIPVTKDQIKKEPKIDTFFFENRNEKIFILDDRKYITNLVEKLLQPFGYKIYSSNNSREALQHLLSQSQDYDLLITDYTMPNLSGISIAKELRNSNINIPIIILTGHGYNITQEDKLNINSIVHKPIILSELLTEINKHI